MNSINKIFYVPWDIETFRANVSKSDVKEYDTHVFCSQTCLGAKPFLDNTIIQSLDRIVKYCELVGYKSVCLVGHNIYKYDNHFLLNALKENKYREYNLKVDDNRVTFSQENEDEYMSKKSIGKKCVLTSRIRTGSNLDLYFTYKGIDFITKDTFLNTHSTLRSIAQRMYKNSIISEDVLKSELDYCKYDIDGPASKEYIKKIFKNMTESEKKYCKNDVLIIHSLLLNYDKVFKNLDIRCFSDSSSLLKNLVRDEPLNRFFLLKELALSGRAKEKISYSEIVSPFNQFKNMFELYKAAYYGGMTAYNPKYLGRVVKNVTAMDINSSYPNVMLNDRFPVRVKNIISDKYNVDVKHILNSDDYYLLVFTIQEFNKMIKPIKSKFIRQGLVKYYNKNSTTLVLTSDTLRIISFFCEIPSSFECEASVCFFTEFLSFREHFSDVYLKKTDAKFSLTGRSVDLNSSPNDIRILEEYDNSRIYTEADVTMYKYMINSVYGLPALSSHYNKFVMEGGKIVNKPKGHVNVERNIVMALKVTSKALHNLLKPLRFLKPKEIDYVFVYADTDALYIRSEYVDRLDLVLNDYNLGAWDRKELRAIKVNNHKQYVTVTYNGVVELKVAGVDISVTSDIAATKSFEYIAKNVLIEGYEFKNRKSILNYKRVPIIYESKTILKKGNPYIDRIVVNLFVKQMFNKAILEFRELLDREDILGEFSLGGDDEYYMIDNITYSKSEIYEISNKLMGEQEEVTPPLISLEEYIQKDETLYNNACEQHEIEHKEYKVTDFLNVLLRCVFDLASGKVKLDKRNRVNDNVRMFPRRYKVFKQLAFMRIENNKQPTSKRVIEYIKDIIIETCGDVVVTSNNIVSILKNINSMKYTCYELINAGMSISEYMNVNKKFGEWLNDWGL